MKQLLLCTFVFLLAACGGSDRSNPSSDSSSKSPSTTPSAPHAPQIIVEEVTDERPTVESTDSETDTDAEVTPPIEPELTEPEVTEAAPPKPEVTPPPIAVRTYELTKLDKIGIHFLGRSSLPDIGNPPVIYCSNTKRLNHEKVEELTQLIHFLSEVRIEVVSFDKVKIAKKNLIQMVERSINLLSIEPYSHICPRIYLSL